tara:strand:+ start:3248 stop:3484 length:237 start_codon:yes stop_codon:yes gene_type:complete
MKKFKYKLWEGFVYFERQLTELEALYLSVISKHDTKFYKKTKNNNKISEYIKEEVDKMCLIIERKNKVNSILKNKTNE